MERNKCIAMLLAGGQGSRLYALTTSIAKPALSFGGKYRIIDFSLSNCVNSGIDTVGVLTQYKPSLLNAYVGIGSAWDLDTEQGGVHVLPPYVGTLGGAWYKGTANAIYQNINFVDRYEPEYVLILSGDHIYKMDYSEMLKAHIEKEADVSIVVTQVPLEEASRFGTMSVDETGRITKFQEKSPEPESTLASMGIYIFNWAVLKQALVEDEAKTDTSNDFGKDVIPTLLAEGKRLFSYGFSGYWKDVGTVPSYYEASMELLSDKPSLDLFEPHFKVFSNADLLSPQYIGPKAKLTNSLISNACSILGEVHGSILAPDVHVGEGAIVEDSILLPNARIEAGARLHRAIVGERAIIGAGCILGAVHDGEVLEDGITVIENGYELPAGQVVKAGFVMQTTDEV